MIKFTIVVLLVLVAIILFTLLPTSYTDWVDHFRPAALNGWQGASRFYVHNPPWLVFLIFPFALLPPRLGAASMGVLSIAIISAYLRNPKKIMIVAISSPFVYTISQGQVDALPILGLMLPASISLPLLLIKPQGILLAGLRRITIKSVLVASIVIVLSLFIWGTDWLFVKSSGLSAFNLSLFPYSVVAALPLIYLGLKRQSDGLLCLVTLAISPYFMITSLLPAVAALIRESDDWRVWLVVMGESWLYLLLHHFF